jgi:hypothetical protein
MAAIPPAKEGSANSSGNPPAFGAGVAVTVVVVVLVTEIAVGVRKRNGVGVATWPTTCGSADALLAVCSQITPPTTRAASMARDLARLTIRLSSMLFDSPSARLFNQEVP